MRRGYFKHFRVVVVFGGRGFSSFFRGLMQFNFVKWK